MRIPPAVIYRATHGPAYLLAWEQHHDRTWWARLLWIEIHPDGYTGRHARVVAADVAPIPGQDYASVPRHRIDSRTRPPSDPTDPRDPSHRRDPQAGFRLAYERALNRKPEPDF
ncbi:hypothetical protein AGRA3207_003126 [Actinomadura graeca]|uniref:Uncharacterized protein n=1 Tax=Actinomadura graeca TaxID=2750812 RepID=A0ABX8QXI8_9ACTN|nr:hypothetical protein [Actinomadura graeca]QXJ22167.1 hypothetical protein AGRA3207_003126 [Actinomadura graeca]